MAQFESDHYPREFSFEEIISIAWNIYKKNYNLIFSIVFAIQLPVNIITSSMLQLDGLTPESLMNMDASLLIILILLSIFSLLEPIAIVLLVKSITIREEVDFKILVKRALNSLLPVTITMIMMLIFVSILMMAFIIPGIIFAVYWIFTLQVVVVLGLIGIPALRRSFYIVRKRWLRVFLYTLIFAIMGLLVYLLGVGIQALFGDSKVFSILIFTLFNVPMAYFTVAFAVMFINFNDTDVEIMDNG